jgi:pimeloyl-ACP methyl ester carboxylesterase
VICPTTLILGERDVMTPVKGGLTLASLIAGAKTSVLKSAGHMLMSERPDEVLDALTSFQALRASASTIEGSNAAPL